MGNRRSTRHLSAFRSLFFKPRNPKPLFPSPWAWPSCKQPSTLSFRLTNDEDVQESARSRDLSSTASDCSVEAALRAVSSNRLVLDGGSNERSLSTLTEETTSKREHVAVPFEGSVAVQMESDDLYRDFRGSMREMVEASGEEIRQKELAWFEEMLAWYLRMNKRWTHEFIVGAYWDLLLDHLLMVSSCCISCCTSTCSSSSSYASCLSGIEEAEEEDDGQISV